MPMLQPGGGMHSRAESWSVKLVQVLGRKFRACKSYSRHSSGIFPFPDRFIHQTQLHTLAFHWEGDISFLVRIPSASASS